MKRRKLDMKLIAELLRDSKRSDRELAKALGASQPTVTRTRTRLVKEGVIKDFCIVPDFVKLGYEIMAISSFRSKINKELAQKAKMVTMAKPNIIFAARVQGMGMNAVVISLHKNYTDYAKFIAEIVEEGRDDLESYGSLIASFDDLVSKPLSLKYLAEQIGK